jgi:hypothetical protein
VFRPVVASAVVLLIVLSPATGWATQLPPTLKVGEQNLVLNGAGERQKYFLDLYVAGLYLTEPSKQSKAIIDADAPMAIRIAITSKLVSQEKFLASLQEGLKKSTEGNVEPIRAEIKKFRECFADKIVQGDVIDLVYLPNQGVMVFKAGKRKGIVPGLAFKRALFGIWLCERPVDANLKQALLGGAANTQRR